MSSLTWCRQGSRWRAGPYAIELERPGRWILRVDRVDREPVQSMVTYDDQEFMESGVEAESRSLKALKAKAEDLENQREADRLRKRYLVVLAISVLGFFAMGTAVAHVSVLMPFLLLIAAVWSVTKIIELSMIRTWDRLTETYQ